MYEYDRAIGYLHTPSVLSIADVELLHTWVIQSVAYSNTCDDVRVSGFEDGVICGTEVDEEQEKEEHRAC